MYLNIYCKYAHMYIKFKDRMSIWIEKQVRGWAG